MTYFEYSLEMDKLDLKFDLSINNLINEGIYQESISSFFIKLTNAFNAYVNDARDLHKLYKEKRNLNRGIIYISNLCRYKAIADQQIFVRGYNGSVVNPLSLEQEIQTLKNLMTYAKLKINDPKMSDYLERYEADKSGWDIFYKVKIKDVPVLYNEINQKIDDAINKSKETIKSLGEYFENAPDQKQSESEFIFKKIIEKIKNSVKNDINIITMNYEAIQYEIGHKFAKLTEKTADKLVKKDISDKDIVKASKFVKEIKYSDDSYKIYKTKYDNVSAMNYGGANIYVDNKFFDLPRGYQLAILYHEIGHHQCKHFKPDGFKAGTVNKNFELPIEDTSKLVKRIRQDLAKFNYSLSFSPYSQSKNYTDGEEFIYLLIEWEADRFASNIVGKRLIRKALTSRFDDMLKKHPVYKDPKKEKMHYNFNMDRMRIRTQNI